MILTLLPSVSHFHTILLKLVNIKFSISPVNWFPDTGLIVTLHVETASAGHLLAVGILQVLSCYYQCFGSGFIDSGSGSSILGWIQIRIRIQHFRLNTNPDTDPYPEFWWAKLKIIYICYFFPPIYLIKNCNLRMPKLEEKPSALKREHSALQTMKFLNFFSIFVGHFFLFRPVFGFGIQIHWPDWSGSRYLSEYIDDQVPIGQSCSLMNGLNKNVTRIRQ